MTQGRQAGGRERKAKIVCTLGPAADDAETVRALAEAGMSAARLNASHGTTTDRRDLIGIVREVDEWTNRPIAVLLDLQGPEVRTAAVSEPVSIPTGATVRFVPGDTVDGDVVGLSTAIGAATRGEVVMIDDGVIEETVTDVDGDEGTETDNS
mgnify:CR=1 FL=1